MLRGIFFVFFSVLTSMFADFKKLYIVLMKHDQIVATLLVLGLSTEKEVPDLCFLLSFFICFKVPL